MPSMLEYDMERCASRLRKLTLHDIFLDNANLALFTTYMELLNERNSPGGYSQFPAGDADYRVAYDNTRGSSSSRTPSPGSPQRYTASGVFLYPVDARTVVFCERCETHYDVEFNIVTRPDLLDRSEYLVRQMSFVHCPRGTSYCAYHATANWRQALRRLLDMKQLCNINLGLWLQDRFAEAGHTVDAVDTSIGQHVRDYELVRLEWHKHLAWSRVMSSGVGSGSPSAIPCPGWPEGMVAWGDLFTDFNLCRDGRLRAQDILYLYDMDLQSVEYLHYFMDEWQTEVRWINAYAGARRLMQGEQFTRAKRAAQRVGAAMKKLFEANETVARETMHENIRDRDNAILKARSRFLEVQSAVLDVSTGTRIEVMPRNGGRQGHHNGQNGRR